MQAIQRATWLIAAIVTAGLLGAASIAAAQAIGAPPPGSLQDASDNRRPRARGLRPPKVTVSPQAHARAAELTSQAQTHYDSGHYEEASESYRQAYAVVPAPELLFNLGQCQRLLGRSERALKYFEAYLRLRPDAPHRPLVEQLIEESKLIGPPDSALNPTPQEPPAISVAPGGSGTRAELPHRARHANVMPLPPPEPLAESQPPPTRLLADDRYSDHESPALYERWWFWTAIAVVAAGAAVTTYAVVSDQENEEPQAMTTLGTVAWD
jgi:tetratricopeptide (TPR) repeat protein